MKMKWIYIPAIIFIAALTACRNNESNTQEEHEEHHDEHSETVILPENKIKNLDLDIGKIEKQIIYTTVQANGELSVPPQNSALITAIVGANIQEINVLEGEKVKKGQVLASVAHPDLIKMQSDFLNKWQQLNFLEAEYQRKKKMYEENAASGKSLQQAETQYLAMRSEVSGLQKQLEQLHIDINRLKKGEISAQIPVVSPINGFVEKIFVQLGQFVGEQQAMFSVLNNDHLHADLLVYESDAAKVKIGQKVFFHTQSQPQKNIAAHIIAVSKSFEKDPKAIHIHADIDNHHDTEQLIAGMFIEGSIVTDSTEAYALKEQAIAVENNIPTAFKAEKKANSWLFEPVALNQVVKQDSFYIFKNKPEGLFARNNAYYLISELKKGEMEHDD